MNTQLLKRLYSIYSPSGKEQGMMNFLSAYIRTLPGNISLTQDRYGNLYAVKRHLPLPDKPYRPGGTLQSFKGFQGRRDTGHHFRPFTREKTVREPGGGRQERHIRLPGMSEEIRCPQGSVLQGGRDRMQGQFTGVHALFRRRAIRYPAGPERALRTDYKHRLLGTLLGRVP